MVEDLIYKAIKAIPIIASKTARFAGMPAVFYQLAPNDKDSRWDGRIMYPRIDYGVDWMANPERKTAGMLLINIWCTNESETAAEDFEMAVQSELSEMFMTDESGTYAMVWVRSDYFESTSEKEPKTVGYTMMFDVLAFPNQETIVPDPVWSINSFIKDLDDNTKVIGHDVLSALWKPTNASPAVYVRMLNNEFSHSSYACAWMKASLGVHVIAPDPQARQTALQRIVHELSLRGEAITNDGSPFFVQQIKYNTSADTLKDGQMTIIGEYGVLSREPESEILNNINFNHGFAVQREGIE